MSLIRTTIRMCAVAALRGRTWAENRVYDSDRTPLLDALLGVSEPYITVFTDDEVVQEIYGRDVYTGDHRLSLVLEYGVASAVEVENKGVVLKFPQTDQALEALVDILETQAINAIVSDPSSPFGELLRRMINRFYRVPSVRGGSEEKGTRWAARQLTLICDTIASPAPGVVLGNGHPVRDFITLARSDEYLSLGMKEGADLIEKVLNETAAPDWRQGQAWLGLTKAGISGIGIVPMPDPAEVAEDEEGYVFNHPRPEWDDTLETRVPPLERDDAQEPPEEPDSPESP